MQTARKIVELPGDCKGIGHGDISTCTKAQINYAKATVCKAGVQLANGTKQSDKCAVKKVRPAFQLKPTELRSQVISNCRVFEVIRQIFELKAADNCIAG